jgi:hypothetical protein
MDISMAMKSIQTAIHDTALTQDILFKKFQKDKESEVEDTDMNLLNMTGMSTTSRQDL